ncbi:MAG: type II toxin-antitoxin system prevent-host-death family antitoxin [Pseudomonadota bacterium]|nr:type II toxin-antitoxin system prevent-host-death family antitoxin [Pseudomonadota bacterium]
MEVSAKELRLRLSDYLKRAARGYAVDVSMRGKRIARLVPVKKDRKSKEDQLFGIWSDRKDFDVNSSVREMRKGRYF